jgi:hypothetical protein
VKEAAVAVEREGGADVSNQVREKSPVQEARRPENLRAIYRLLDDRPPWAQRVAIPHQRMVTAGGCLPSAMVSTCQPLGGNINSHIHCR